MSFGQMDTPQLAVWPAVRYIHATPDHRSGQGFSRFKTSSCHQGPFKPQSELSAKSWNTQEDVQSWIGLSSEQANSTTTITTQGKPYNTSCSASIGFKRFLQTDASSKVYVIKLNHVESSIQEPSCDLKDEAQNLAINEPHRFREIYGDYYLAGVQRIASLNIAIKITGNITRAEQSIRISMGAGNKASVAGSVDHSDTKSNTSAEFSIEIRQEAVGFKSGGPRAESIGSVNDCIEWYRDESHIGGRAVVSLLRHYSYIVPEIGRSSEDSADTLAKEYAFYERVQELGYDVESNPVPRAHQAEVQQRINELQRETQINMIPDVSARTDSLQDLEDLVREMRSRQRWLQNALSNCGPYDKTGSIACSNPGVWQEGYPSEDAQAPFQAMVKTRSYELIHPSHPGVHYPSLNCFEGLGSNQIIVGILAKSLNSYNGWAWFNESQSVLLGSRAELHIKTNVGLTITTHWTVDVYYVEKDQFMS